MKLGSLLKELRDLAEHLDPNTRVEVLDPQFEYFTVATLERLLPDQTRVVYLIPDKET
jgi:hypothetical protein